jgi:hypothetical protein
MPDLTSMLDRAEHAVSRVPLPAGGLESLQRRRDRKRRNQRIAAAVVGIAVFVLPVALIAVLSSRDRAETPGTRPGGSAEEPGPPGRVRGTPPARGVPKVDYVIDLNTGVMTPLPETILRTAGETSEGTWPAWLRDACSGGGCGDARYVVSPDGTLLAYVGTGDEGTPQIFIAGIDGARVRQMTHEPTGATWPAWSPDGTMIAYARSGVEVSTGLFVLDVATGESRRVTDEIIFDGLQFTPDRASLLYTSSGGLRRVPIAGGGSTLLIGAEGRDPGDLGGAGNGSLSPDGSLVTFQGTEVCCVPGPRDVARWVANADGTGRRQVAGCYDSIPAGTWSPDGSRIVCNESVPPTPTILVVDVATGDAMRVAKGRAAIWLDDHTLVVEV